MITVSFKDSNIVLAPNSSDEMDFLIDNLAKRNKCFFKDNSWNVPSAEIKWVNKVLIPFKDRLYLDDSFKAWASLMRQNAVAPSAIIQKGVVKSYIRPQNNSKIPHSAIEDVTKYFFKGAVNSKKYKEGKWDGYIKLYREFDRSFPTGLINLVCDELTRRNIAYKIIPMYNESTNKQFNWTIDDGIIPDPDQIDSINAAIEGKRGLVKAPTGFGKTAVFAKRLTAGLGVKTLFIANKKSLLDDAADEFLNGVKGLVKVDKIKDGNFGDTKLTPDINVNDIKPLSAPVVVATIQSLSARLKDPRTKSLLEKWLRFECQLVIVDECQALGTKTWDYVMDKCQAPYRIGLSATPRRTDGATLKLMATTGEILFTTTAEEQIEKGRLCELNINYQVFDQGLYNYNDGDVNYNEMYKMCISENENRNRECIVKPTLKMLEDERFVLVLVQFIEHGHILRNMFLAEGINENDVKFIWGETSDKTRKDTIDAFRKADFKILIGSTIFDAGVNIPIISGVVLGGAGNSDITLIQRIGRGVRNCDYDKVIGRTPKFIKDNNGEKITEVYDIIDINSKFFHKQSINRYYNSRDEFGKSRVNLLGDISDLRISSKTSRSNKPTIESQGRKQQDILDEFGR